MRGLRKKRLIKKSVFYSLIFLFFLGGIIGFFYIPYFRIKKISIEGNTTVATEDLLAEVSNYLNAKYFKIIPNDNILILSKEKVIGDLLKKFSRLKDTSLNKNFPDTLSIIVKERNKEALFCPEKDKCFFLDGNGLAFEQAPNFSPGVYLTFFDERGSSTPAWESNSQVLPQEQFKNLINFKNLISGDNIKILEIILKKENIYQLQTNEGWYILLNDQNNAQITYQNLKLALDQIKDKRKNLDYIDLRFGNKVFYKFR